MASPAVADLPVAVLAAAAQGEVGKVRRWLRSGGEVDACCSEAQGARLLNAARWADGSMLSWKCFVLVPVWTSAAERMVALLSWKRRCTATTQSCSCSSVTRPLWTCRATPESLL